MPSIDNGAKMEGTDDWSIPQAIKENPLFIEIGHGSVINALEKLDSKMREMHLGHLISQSSVRPYFGQLLTAGRLGLWNVSGRPVVAIKPGYYWNFRPNVNFVRSVDITDQIDFMGLTVAQVGQSEALVIQDPQNRVFVIRNGGFVAYGATGRFKILSVVDTLDLGERCAVKEPNTQRILGYKYEVKTKVSDGNKGGVDVTVATFLNIPANNVAILQTGKKLVVLEAGQHVITNPHTTFRNFYSLGERQIGIKTQPVIGLAYTLEGVPVVLDLNLRYQLFDPLALTAHYDDPVQAISNPAQTAVNGVISRLSYQQFMKAQKLSGDNHETTTAPWIEHFKVDCVKELSALSKVHGIHILAFDVMDRKLEGALGKDLERQAETVLQNQMEATQIELRNHINIEKQKGILAIAQIEADAVKTKTNTEYYNATKLADAKYYETMKEAEAKAQASALIIEQEAKNIIALAEAEKRKVQLQGEAYQSVQSPHAQKIQTELLEVEKRKAMPNNTVWFESKELAPGVPDGFNFAKGVGIAK